MRYLHCTTRRKSLRYVDVLADGSNSRALTVLPAQQDLLTLLETYAPGSQQPKLDSLAGLTVAWVGDSNNILNDMIVSFGRIGINLNIATPKGYELDQTVLNTMESGFEKEKPKGKLLATNSPEEAVRNADVLVTDTWYAPFDTFLANMH